MQRHTIALYNRIKAECGELVSKISADDTSVDITLLTGHHLVCTQSTLHTPGGMLYGHTDEPIFNIRMNDEYDKPIEDIPITPDGQNWEGGVTIPRIIRKIQNFNGYVQQQIIGHPSNLGRGTHRRGLLY